MTAERLRSFWAWLSNDEQFQKDPQADPDAIDWYRALPFVLIHLACLGAIWTGVSQAAAVFAVVTYFARMFFITAFYHRYFSHGSFRASRALQFVFAVLGCTAGQRGPLWWAAHHRLHHHHSDSPEDPHSPAHRGFWFSHTLWFLTRQHFSYPKRYVKDWHRYPELVWLERFDWVPFVLFAVFCYTVGTWFDGGGMQFLVWGFFVSTTVLYHATYTINSLAHRFGTRRYETHDNSRNNVWLALLTLGEGWHNNHHRYPAAARQGFFWWEVDVSYWVLRLMSAMAIVRDLRPVPASVLNGAAAPRRVTR